MLYWGFIDFTRAISGRCCNLISDQDIGETKRMLSEEYIMASIDLQFIYLCRGQSSCSPPWNWTEHLAWLWPSHISANSKVLFYFCLIWLFKVHQKHCYYWQNVTTGRQQQNNMKQWTFLSFQHSEPCAWHSYTSHSSLLAGNTLEQIFCFRFMAHPSRNIPLLVFSPLLLTWVNVWVNVCNKRRGSGSLLVNKWFI